MPVQPVAPPLPGTRLSAQEWRDLTFLHWSVDPAAVAGLVPPGVRPDVLDGQTFIGLVPFVMRRAGPGARLAVPYFGDFCETNVRLYSVDDADRHGIVFLTLDAARLATVLLARVGLGLPYAWSAMRARREGDEMSYRSVRRWPRRARSAPPRSTVTVQIGPTTDPTPTEVWLTARWGLHTRVAGRTVWVPNEHGPWPLHEARLVSLGGGLVASCGLDVAGAPSLRPLWSPGVRTSFGWPTSLRA
jgi:uncharacterized protein YqjF (DUF2071 family)